MGGGASFSSTADMWCTYSWCLHSVQLTFSQNSILARAAPFTLFTGSMLLITAFPWEGCFLLQGAATQNEAVIIYINTKLTYLQWLLSPRRAIPFPQEKLTLARAAFAEASVYICSCSLRSVLLIFLRSSTPWPKHHPLHPVSLSGLNPSCYSSLLSFPFILSAWPKNLLLWLMKYQLGGRGVWHNCTNSEWCIT